MAERSVPLGKFITVTLWVAVAALLLAAWISFLFGSDRLPALLGFTGCATSAAAATAHVRLYAGRICSLIRFTGGLTGGEDAELHVLG